MALDLRIIAGLKAAPEETLPSLAPEVMRRLAARQRGVLWLRLGTAVGVACLVAAALNAAGAGFLRFVADLVLGGGTSATLGLAYGKMAEVLRGVVARLGAVGLSGSLGADLAPYQTLIWTAVAGGLVVVVLMMYLMGLWLRSPKEGKSWLARRSLGSGLQVW
ncbi:MAG: hypothetical protein WAW06_07270 [bacterium]